uniref:Uncharacterized protein AlNc14C126G6821 n=1 Tax=Albugo laibachii Nc14 TaxID=890382 RepID=F0WJV1_9STRA|nr:conserved hypothetical protein [Albugo laibachii Nc14]|eukprot:CCA21553.1 conserved hypothetical protein [Albugo laibachii Nc14]
MQLRNTRSLIPEDRFDCPPLADEEHSYLIAQAKNSARSLIEVIRNASGPVQWISSGSHKGVQVFRGKERRGDLSASQMEERPIDEIQYVCGATKIQATLEEVAAFFDTTTYDKTRRYAHICSDDIIESKMLYTLVPPTVDARMHQITVQWTAIEVPTTWVRNRDFCTLECQDLFTDYTGRRGWVRSMHSIKLACCPEITRETGLVRGSMYNMGYVCVECEDKGYVELIHTVQVNLKGNLRLPRSLYFYFCRRRVGLLAHVSTFLQQERVARRRILQELELVPKNERDHCRICRVRFRFLTRKMRCRTCGEVVCSDCNQKFNLAHNVDRGTSSSMSRSRSSFRVRICVNCSTESTCPEEMITSAEEMRLTQSSSPAFSPSSSRPRTRRSLSGVDRLDTYNILSSSGKQLTEADMRPCQQGLTARGLQQLSPKKSKQSRYMSHHLRGRDRLLWAGYGACSPNSRQMNKQDLEMTSELVYKHQPAKNMMKSFSVPTMTTDETSSTISDVVPLMESQLPLLASQMTEDDDIFPGKVIKPYHHDQMPIILGSETVGSRKRTHLPQTMHEASVEADDDWDLNQSYGVDDDVNSGPASHRFRIPQTHRSRAHSQKYNDHEYPESINEHSESLLSSQSAFTESDFDGGSTIYLMDESQMSTRSNTARKCSFVSSIMYDLKLPSDQAARKDFLSDKYTSGSLICVGELRTFMRILPAFIAFSTAQMYAFGAPEQQLFERVSTLVYIPIPSTNTERAQAIQELNCHDLKFAEICIQIYLLYMMFMRFNILAIFDVYEIHGTIL